MALHPITLTLKHVSQHVAYSRIMLALCRFFFFTLCISHLVYLYLVIKLREK